MVSDIAVQDFVNALKEEPNDNNTTYNATVSHVDDEGVVWVSLYGSDKKTPTASTSSEVKSGDKVTVNWRNNKLYIGGNYSNPSAGVTTVNRVEGVANNAQATADVAFTAANNAVADAERAHVAADEAEGHAQTALRNAGIAQTAAESAQTSADSALVSLSTVEDVVGVLNWITAHGTMTANGSTALDPSKVYFIRDNNGDYTVGSYNYSVVSEPKAEDRTSYYTLSVDESVQNYVATHVTVNTEGMWLIPDQNGSPTTNGKKILIATGAGSTYTTAGTYIIDRSSGTDKVLASFRTDGITIGENLNGKTRTNVNADGMQIVRKDSGNDIELANIGYGLGNAESGTLNAPYFTFGGRSTTTTAYSASATYSIGDLCVHDNKIYVCIADIETPEAWNSSHWRFYIGNYSVAEGVSATDNGEFHPIVAAGYVSHSEGGGTVATGDSSHAEGWLTAATGYYAHAEGGKTKAIGAYAHAEGDSSIAKGNISHAEGEETFAEGQRSHAEGGKTKAIGEYSHAEGYACVATGYYAHAEGIDTRAIAYASHAQNRSTVATESSQTVIGKFNTATRSGSGTDSDPYTYSNAGNYAFIIGNGYDDDTAARSNALTVDWDGNVDASGEITDGNGSTVSKAHCFSTGITATSITAQNTNTKVPITSIDIARDFTYDSTNKGVKCGKSGRYFVSLWLASDSTATTGDIYGVGVLKNGSSLVDPAYHRLAGTYDTVQMPPTYMSFLENDVITIYVRNNTSARGKVTNCRFAIWEVG